MARGYLALVLHAHLPFVRHPEAPSYLEEEWFFEAITETYIPLLLAFEHLLRDEIDFRLTLSFSGSLLAMLTDDLLKERYAHKLDQLIELADKECGRTWDHAAPSTSSRRCTATGSSRSGTAGGVTAGTSCARFARCKTRGSSRSSPASRPTPSSRCWTATGPPSARRSIRRRDVRASLRWRTQGMWLGECGYVPGVDELLREEGIRYFFVDTHGLLFAEPRPVFGVHAPVYCRSGVAAFGRDVESSKQVWSAQEGYPGDPVYRDFYRDIGFDLPLDYIAPYLPPGGSARSRA